MTTDLGLGKGRYLKKEIERKLMKQQEEFDKKMRFVIEKNKKKIPTGATFGEYGHWIYKKTGRSLA